MTDSNNDTAAAFDFDSVEVTETATLVVKDPTRAMAPTPWVITLASEIHASRRAFDFKRQRVKSARLASSLGKGKGIPTDDPEDIEHDLIDKLVACTLGWKGAKVPFSAGAARTLYADPKRVWVRRQVIEALDDLELFTRSSARS